MSIARIVVSQHRQLARLTSRLGPRLLLPLREALPCNRNAAIVLYFSTQPRQRQSSSPTEQSRNEKEPKASSTRHLLRALRQTLAFRPLSGAFRGQNLRRLYRQSPEELVLAIVLLACISCCVAYVGYSYFSYFQAKQFTRFPPAIAKSMRRAIYYSNYGPDPKLALKYYKLALQQCEEAGLDPFSDEVMGIKIQMAAWLEKLGNYHQSIEVLEAVLRDNKRWVEKMEQAIRDGLIDEAGSLKVVTLSKKEQESANESGSEAREIENLWHKRTRILGKCVGISVKLGELYGDEHVLKQDDAGERLVWAVETVLKEVQRRQSDGVKEGEGDWMSPEEIGGSMEALANHYESKSQHYLAAPLYLQALTLSPQKTCHAAVLMNNLAISLAQQPIDKVPTSADPVDQNRPTRASLLASARAWAKQAHTTGSQVEGEGRTSECDEACAVALCNLGEIAAMSGDMDEAKRRFKESLNLSKRIHFQSGITQAQEGLKAASM